MVQLFLFILVPPIIAGILHMFVVKTNWFSSLSLPIHKSLFGANKTWRGIVVISLANAISTILVNLFTLKTEPLMAFWYGLIIGIAYMLAELPNSWFKRSRGIEPGKSSGSNPILFKLLDKVDSAAGLSIAAAVLFGLSFLETLGLFILASILHVLFSLLLVALSVKKSF